MKGVVSGVTGAAPIWNGIMQHVLKNQPNLPPIKTPGVVGRQVCNDTGAIGGNGCPSHYEYITKGSEKKARTTSQTTRMSIPVNKTTGKMTSAEDPDHEMREQTVIKDSTGAIYCIDCAQ